MHKYSVRANYNCLEQSTFYKEPVLLAFLDKEKVSTLASSVPDPAVKFLSLPDLYTSEVKIRILPSSCKNSKNFYCCVTSL
jgi:hypothetical protein